jgi:hypothetical protein
MSMFLPLIKERRLGALKLEYFRAAKKIEVIDYFNFFKFHKHIFSLGEGPKL